MDFTVGITVNNASFDGSERGEVADILQHVAEKVRDGYRFIPQLHDSNGNMVGSATFIEHLVPEWQKMKLTYGEGYRLNYGKLKVATVSYNSMKAKGEADKTYVAYFSLADDKRVYGESEAELKIMMEKRFRAWLKEMRLTYA